MLSRTASHALVRSVFFAFTFLCLLVGASAQRGIPSSDTGDPGTGGVFVIVGTVFLPSGQRVDRPIRVRLYTPTRGTVTTMTDDNGAFTFRRLASGSYSVVIDGEKDFEPVNEAVNIVQVLRNVTSTEATILVQIRLRMKANAFVKPEVMNAELADVPPAAVEIYNKALELAQAGKTKSAIEKLKQAIAAYSDFMLAFNQLGIQYIHLGDLDKANDALLSALTISPDAFEPLLNHGIVLTMLGQFEPAVAELKSALKRRDQSALGHFYLGQALANLRRFDESEAHLRRAIELGGDETKDAHRFLGAIYLQRGDRERGISELEAYVRLAPNAKDAEQVRQMLKQLKNAK